MASKRLTNVMRDAFIRAVMADVPQINYGEQAKKLMQLFAYNELPETVKAVYDNKDTRKYLDTNYVYCISTHYIVAPSGWKPNAHQQKELDELEQLHGKQLEAHNELRSKLRGAIYSVTTIKTAKQLLPEFEKYLPADEAAAIKTLPAVANLVADLMSAGWPKDQVLT